MFADSHKVASYAFKRCRFWSEYTLDIKKKKIAQDRKKTSIEGKMLEKRCCEACGTVGTSGFAIGIEQAAGRVLCSLTMILSVPEGRRALL